jgi:hypothetical protein
VDARAFNASKSTKAHFIRDIVETT